MIAIIVMKFASRKYLAQISSRPVNSIRTTFNPGAASLLEDLSYYYDQSELCQTDTRAKARDSRTNEKAVGLFIL